MFDARRHPPNQLLTINMYICLSLAAAHARACCEVANATCGSPSDAMWDLDMGSRIVTDLCTVAL